MEPSDFQVVSLVIEISYADYFRAILGHRQSDKQNSSQLGMFIMVVHSRIVVFANGNLVQYRYISGFRTTTTAGILLYMGQSIYP